MSDIESVATTYQQSYFIYNPFLSFIDGFIQNIHNFSYSFYRDGIDFTFMYNLHVIVGTASKKTSEEIHYLVFLPFLILAHTHTHTQTPRHTPTGVYILAMILLVSVKFHSVC